MKKDRLLLLDETVVPASLTQLREVTLTKNSIHFLFLIKFFVAITMRIIQR